MPSSNGESSLQLRVLLAFALSAVVLLLLAPRKPPPTRPPPPPAERGAPAAEPAAPPSELASGPGLPPAAEPALFGSLRQASEEKRFVVEDDLYRVELSNRGAVVKSWKLKRYQDGEGRLLELVNQPAADALGHPFIVWTEQEQEGLRQQLNDGLFEVRADRRRPPATVTFEYSDGTVSARKQFRFHRNSYVVEVTSQVHQNGNPVEHELAWRGGFGDHTVPDGHLSTGVISARLGKVQRQPYAKIKDPESKSSGGPWLYAGIEDRFFAAVFMPPAEANTGAPITLVRSFRSEYQPEGVEAATGLLGVSVGGSAQNEMRAFVGPKAVEVLQEVFPEPGAQQRHSRGEPVMTLAELVDFGYFTFIANPMLLALKWIYNHVVPNYGWAIVLLTIVINFALFPLKLKSMKSALKMQKIAPQVKAVQEKYKKLKFNDPKKQEMNKEVMDLYRKHGVNPVGGCFPMLLQIPFFIGFYNVLIVSIEMRHAPWFGWIKDLSAKDPYYVLPIVMTATMFILQKMTPMTTADPMQRKMFTLMPLFFGVMFLSFSSGLVLYWLVGNLVGLGQQWYINRTGLQAEVGRKPAATRTVKAK